MFTDLTPFGEPIEKEEFVSHYMELFEGAIKKMYAIDTFYPKERQYLNAEKQKITLLYDQFEVTYQREPDYRYLSQCLTQNILKKEHLFAPHETNLMSAEHFANIYTDQLKNQKLCTVEQFGQDAFYLLDREYHRAITRYNEQNQAIDGYPELQIQNNCFLQQQLLKQLTNEFHEIYQNYQIQ
ncbi:hypothetical protein [Enterococcus sp. 5B3_DIV0040]|uniref:hypothetical protein n=1 Tax=Enterococcus sp. 5B3_DIV0040 TaxID=1834182 RepID=UPI000A34DD80|nr:hypothetical protein [Enterococcus sp. 5B3_DIV0040]OTO01255.1 hypothetical protein A5883_003572 [Enterococcus sp. 5B3_DIV0040]